MVCGDAAAQGEGRWPLRLFYILVVLEVLTTPGKLLPESMARKSTCSAGFYRDFCSLVVMAPDKKKKMMILPA